MAHAWLRSFLIILDQLGRAIPNSFHLTGLWPKRGKRSKVETKGKNWSSLVLIKNQSHLLVDSLLKNYCSSSIYFEIQEIMIDRIVV